MQDLHCLQVSRSETSKVEAVDPAFLTKELLRAREKTWRLFAEIQGKLREGMTELQARQVVVETSRKHGIEKHWHRPYIRFGPGTALSFHDAIQEEWPLQRGDCVYIDIGPVWPDLERGLEYEGDVADTFVFGASADPGPAECAATARQLFLEAEKQWRIEGISGKKIYSFLSKSAEELGYLLQKEVDGHRISDFPHHKFSRERLANFDFSPSNHLWVLEVQILHPSKKYGAFFEDILGITHDCGASLEGCAQRLRI